MTLKKINAGLTILCSQGRVHIEVHDEDARIRILDIEVSPEKFTAALGRQGNVDCKASVLVSEKIGLKHECKQFTFMVAENQESPFMDCSHENTRERAKIAVKEKCPKGWEADAYFNSADSFFMKDGDAWARTFIRRWVKKK